MTDEDTFSLGNFQLLCNHLAFKNKMIYDTTQYMHINLPTPQLGQDTTQGQFFKRSLTDLNLEFSF